MLYLVSTWIDHHLQHSGLLQNLRVLSLIVHGLQNVEQLNIVIVVHVIDGVFEALGAHGFHVCILRSIYAGSRLCQRRVGVGLAHLEVGTKQVKVFERHLQVIHMLLASDNLGVLGDVLVRLFSFLYYSICDLLLLLLVVTERRVQFSQLVLTVQIISFPNFLIGL